MNIAAPQSNQFIFPTHSCFDDSIENMVQMIDAQPSLKWTDALRLVHAICSTPELPLFSHAWLEIDRTIVIWTGIYLYRRETFVSSRHQYYEKFGVKETRKYTIFEVQKNNWTFGTYGPWEDRFISLCRNGGMKSSENPPALAT